jgi:glycosyltransferase involved in cell wall biosynthesis
LNNMRLSKLAPGRARIDHAAIPAAEQPKRTVLVYRNDLLAASETFIREQILAYCRWRAILIGKNRLTALSLEDLNVRLLRPLPSYSLSMTWWAISRRLGSVPFPVLARLRREAPSLLHAHFGMDAIHAWPIARTLGVPMVVTLHGYDINVYREWWEAGHWGRWFRHYPRRLLDLAKQPQVHFVAVSRAIRDRAVEFGIPAEKVTVQYIGIDVRRFAPGGLPIAQRERRVLFVGRLVEKKGCEYLIRAFSEVQTRIPDAVLVIGGEGDLRLPLQRLADKLGVRAQFRGVLTQAEVRRELEHARAFCLPSVTAHNGDAEGCGLVQLEAQASGVPIVTSATGGAGEGVAEGITGFTFHERDIGTLARRLTELLTDDACALAMSRASPSFVAKNFDIHRCTEDLEALYDKLLDRDRATRHPSGYPSSPMRVAG